MKTFGSIWPKRSSTPRSPKSGEQDDQIAPSEVTASISATDLRQIRQHGRDAIALADAGGSQAPAAARETERVQARPSSADRAPCPRRGTPSRRRHRSVRSRFSAKLSRRVGKELRARHLVAIDRQGGAPLSPITPQKSQTRSQNRSGCGDRPGMQFRVGFESSRPCRRLTCRMKAMTWVAATRSGLGVHSGVSFILNSSLRPIAMLSSCTVNHKNSQGARTQATKGSQSPRARLRRRTLAAIVRPSPRNRKACPLSAVTGFKRLALAVAALVLAVFGALAVVSFLIPADQVREAVKAEIRAVTGLDPVLRGDVSVSLFPYRQVSFSDVALGDGAGEPPLAGRATDGAAALPAAADRPHRDRRRRADRIRASW